MAKETASGMTNYKVNNAFYDDLGERWLHDDTHPVAVLRAEARIKVAYVLETLRQRGLPGGSSILDIACGAGLVSLPLAQQDYRLTGIDLSANSLTTARTEAAKRGISPSMAAFTHADAHRLPFVDASFDAVLALDFLEHTDTPQQAIQEAARVLKPNGVFVFHTFNRTLVAKALAIHALELFMRDAPKHIHVYELFIKPAEMQQMLDFAGLKQTHIQGLRPRFESRAFWQSLLQRRIHQNFMFSYTRSLTVGYIGYAIKNTRRNEPVGIV